MKNRLGRTGIAYVVLCLVALLVVGCGGGTSMNDAGNYYYYPEDSQTDVASEAEFTIDKSQEDYVIVSIDYAGETLKVHRYANDLEYQYYFSLSTEFLDKYGNRTSSVNFVPGSIVHLGTVDSEGKLRSIQIAEDVWEYTNITRFSIDSDRGIFEIADTKYVFDDEAYVFSEQEIISAEDISNRDVLTVIGKEKRILSVIVTTGHGTLALENTDLFEDSFLQLNTNIFAIITHNMKMEVPEGTYVLAVANDGWGGSCEITITRGETTTIDLDTIKGDGPNYGMILFAIEMEGAKLYIDEKRVDYTEPISLRYGWHTLRVTAEGCEDWSKKLYVNSEEATIEIEMEKEVGTSSASGGTNNSTDETDSNGEQTNQEGTDESNQENENSTNLRETENADQYLRDYMSTLTDLIGSL